MTSTDTPKPRRGEIWLTNWGSGRTGEPTKARPSVVLSNDLLPGESVFDLVIMAALSASLPPAPGRPLVPPTPRTGLDHDSAVMIRGIRGMSRGRLLRRVGEVDAGTMRLIDRSLLAVLGLRTSGRATDQDT